MKDVRRDYGILNVIAMLSSQGASGRLQIRTGMTDGALFFDRGQLVDARLGRLTGFQAINALASVPDASYDFDAAIVPPAQSSITASERVLLKDFFGVEAEHDAGPRQVVPLQSEEYSRHQQLISDDDDEVTLISQEPRIPLSQEPRIPLSQEPRIPLSREPRIPLSHDRSSRSAFRPAVFAIFLIALFVVAAVALVQRFRQPDSTASVTPPVQTASPANVPGEGSTETTSPTEASSPTTTTSPTETAAAVPDLSGNWKVVNTVEQTSYEAYRNMQIGFNVSINQAGKDFTGTGEKISENGQSLPAAGRTPILVKGTIDGDKVQATFSEQGAARKTNGRFVWTFDKRSNGLTGTFASTAARTRGKSAATKVF